MSPPKARALARGQGSKAESEEPAEGVRDVQEGAAGSPAGQSKMVVSSNPGGGGLSDRARPELAWPDRNRSDAAPTRT